MRNNFNGGAGNMAGGMGHFTPQNRGPSGAQYVVKGTQQAPAPTQPAPFFMKPGTQPHVMPMPFANQVMSGAMQ